ncbi:hypothetical protein PCANB_001277 [Pneumocystis canis]|nr:hypothetical protein PCANB_001277 [Pneumocystis canis]
MQEPSEEPLEEQKNKEINLEEVIELETTEKHFFDEKNDEKEFREDKSNDSSLDHRRDDLFGDDSSENEHYVKESDKELLAEFQEETLDESEYQETRRILESTLMNRAIPESTDNDLYYVKMPNFLTIIQKPFDPESYLEEARAENETMVHSYDNNQRILLKVENTIRWRYVKNNDGTYSKQSNARFIKWSDGSLSLLLGSELFSAVTKSNFSEHKYLCLSHESQNLLMSRKQFTKSMTFLPIDTSSSTHKRLTEAILRGNMKRSSIVEFVNVEDPEKVKREAERIEEEKIRFRRRLESRRRAQDSRYHESPILTIEGLEAEEMNGHSRNMYFDKDNEDRFIVDNESDEIERRERLLKVKGRNIYKKHRMSYENKDEENNEEKGNENNQWYTKEDNESNDYTDYTKEVDLDEEIIRRVGKRRRVVDDGLDETIDDQPNNTVS